MAVDARPSDSAPSHAPRGRIHGTNHLVLIVDDMDASVRFYRDVLGFEVVRTNARTPDPTRAVQHVRTYFFDIGSADGTLLGMYEVVRGATADGGGPEPAMAARLWPGDPTGPVNPRKMDHLAFNVDTHEDLVWFHTHLRARGVEVSDITVRPADEFVESIYFRDPSGNTLEIATFQWGEPRRNHRLGPSDPSVWMRDADPVPSLRDEG